MQVRETASVSPAESDLSLLGERRAAVQSTTTTIKAAIIPGTAAVRRSPAVPRASQVKPAPPVTALAARVAAVGCMANAEHSVALAHACWDGLIAQYPWTTSTAFSVMMCESHGNPFDHNSSGATGLMQVIRGDASFDPATNMAQAWDKYVGAGHSWGPWSASVYCWRSARNG